MTNTTTTSRFFAFHGSSLLARGDLRTVGLAVRTAMADASERLALYREADGATIDIDVSGTEEQTVQRLYAQFPEAAPKDESSEPATTPAPAPRRRGRPKLGVVSREISLLPDHWQWLAAQRGGASATLRRLVVEARKRDVGAARVRSLIDATHKFMWDIAGDTPGFEEASRALYAHDLATFEARVADFPLDIRAQIDRYIARIRSASP